MVDMVMAATVVDETVSTEAALRERKSEKKKLSRASSSDSDEMYSNSFSKGTKAIPASEDITENRIQIITSVIDKTLILDNNNNNQPPSTMSFDGHNIVVGDADTDTDTATTSLMAAIGGHSEEITVEEKPELDLHALYKLANSHNFVCPSCNTCITKVIILRNIKDFIKSPHLSSEHIEVTKELPVPTSSQPNYGRAIEKTPATQDPGTTADETPDTIICGNCFSFLTPLGAWISARLGFGDKKPAIPDEIETGTAIVKDPSSPTGIQHQPAEITGGGSVTVTMPFVGSGDETAGDQKPSGGRKLEVIKSIVYGGLTEAITSLGIVTSAASAKTPTENIVALAIANLITGLIVIANNLSGLKSNDPKKEQISETEEVLVDQYKETLGDRQHFILHYTLAILSFFIFGLLPPLIYGFSFRDSDDQDLKLAVTAGSSLLSIALLAVGKAYTQKPQKWQDFVKTVVYYITIAFGASGLSYLAGKEFDKLLHELGWFKGNDPTPTLSLPNMDFANPGWGSF